MTNPCHGQPVWKQPYRGRWFNAVYMTKDYDVCLSIIEAMENQQPITFQLQHVPFQKSLPPTETHTERPDKFANALSHLLATASMKECLVPGVSLPDNTANRLVHRGITITSNEQPLLLNERPTAQLKDYYRRRHGRSRTVVEEVDWQAIKRACSKCKPLNTFHTKFATGWLPTNSDLHKTEKLDPKCDFCTSRETNDHILLCPCLTPWRRDFQTKLSQKLSSLQTSPSLGKELMDTVAFYLDQQRPNSPVHIVYHDQPSLHRMELVVAPFSLQELGPSPSPLPSKRIKVRNAGTV